MGNSALTTKGTKGTTAHQDGGLREGMGALVGIGPDRKRGIRTSPAGPANRLIRRAGGSARPPSVGPDITDRGRITGWEQGPQGPICGTTSRFYPAGCPSLQEAPASLLLVPPRDPRAWGSRPSCPWAAEPLVTRRDLRALCGRLPTSRCRRARRRARPGRRSTCCWAGSRSPWGRRYRRRRWRSRRCGRPGRRSRPPRCWHRPR